ncbi:hypothetical protein F5X99DRAFT_182629 [Biscogniauxia marginata]|nr:hypothetical protein F5X99DRAFT_182629 [Biscogniauxia marginata]
MHLTVERFRSRVLVKDQVLRRCFSDGVLALSLSLSLALLPSYSCGRGTNRGPEGPGSRLFPRLISMVKWNYAIVGISHSVAFGFPEGHIGISIALETLLRDIDLPLGSPPSPSFLLPLPPTPCPFTPPKNLTLNHNLPYNSHLHPPLRLPARSARRSAQMFVDFFWVTRPRLDGLESLGPVAETT